MSDDANETVVDLLLQRTISEIDTMSDDVSEKLIALECGHTFTVGTLDSHCLMSEYYTVDPITGRYLGMRAPPTKFQTPPACPTCRGPITSPRYGRVTKRANLDIVEQNVAGSMSRLLDEHGPSLGTIANRVQALVAAAERDINHWDELASEDDFVEICEKRKTLFGKPHQPLPVKMLRDLEMFHGFSQGEAQQWTELTKGIIATYGAIARITCMRSAHAKAYEVAMATLFKLEMDAIASDPSKADGKAQRGAASAAANAKIGQPPRKADRKYHIEAFLFSIELRLVLAQMALARVSQLQFTPDDPEFFRHRQIWITFAEFLYDSCIKDSAKAASLARSCSALRQEARVSIVNLRCTFEKVRLDALENNLKARLSAKDREERTRIREISCELISRQEAEAQKALSQARTRYFQNLPIDSQEEMDEEVLWFEECCSARAEDVFAAYEDLLEHATTGSCIYKFFWLQKRQDMVKTFVFGTRRSGCLLS